MKTSILEIGNALVKEQLRSIHGGFASCSTANQCADIYNLTAFDPLPDSAFVCRNGWCSFV
ncbi:hypothetical protein [Pseudotenacibaculum haliotis]|uniref:Bacteriocin n=1 Tax=Pseudotenacibaculum haliotis TaxID=1862138 RepID=A0ABW5LRK5_9FLAO